MPSNHTGPFRTKSGNVEMVYSYQPGPSQGPGTPGEEKFETARAELDDTNGFLFITSDQTIQVWKFCGAKEDALDVVWKQQPFNERVRRTVRKFLHLVPDAE